MGTDKADLVYQGNTFLEIQLKKAAALKIPDVVISGYRGSRHLDCPILPDAQPERGPLGGLSTCLGAVRNEWALVLAVDAPLVPVTELEKLIDAASMCRKLEYNVIDDTANKAPSDAKIPNSFLVILNDIFLTSMMMPRITVCVVPFTHTKSSGKKKVTKAVKITKMLA